MSKFVNVLLFLVPVCFCQLPVPRFPRTYPAPVEVRHAPLSPLAPTRRGRPDEDGMRSASFDAIKAVVLSHGNRARVGGTHEAPEEAVVVFRRPNNDDRATTTSPPRDAPSREVPASAVEDAREEPIQPRERRDRGAAGVRRSPRAHASSRESKSGGREQKAKSKSAGEEDLRRVRAAAAARSAAPASVETTRKTQLAAEEPRLSRRRRRGGPDEDDDDDDDGGARKTRSATRAKSGERSRAPASRLAASRTPPAASFASLGVAPPTRLPPTATDAAAVTLAVATGGKDTAGGKETQLTQLSTSSGEREQLARFAAAGAHVGLRATGIPAVAAARLEALALARTAVDASRNGAR